jgi:hypothetical protein
MAGRPCRSPSSRTKARLALRSGRRAFVATSSWQKKSREPPGLSSFRVPAGPARLSPPAAEENVLVREGESRALEGCQLGIDTAQENAVTRQARTTPGFQSVCNLGPRLISAHARPVRRVEAASLRGVLARVEIVQIRFRIPLLAREVQRTRVAATPARHFAFAKRQAYNRFADRARHLSAGSQCYWLSLSQSRTSKRISFESTVPRNKSGTAGEACMNWPYVA